jgi:NAD(P)-dependent dehydrogenase (short-subunit alcohol dehydrogenase family)
MQVNKSVIPIQGDTTSKEDLKAIADRISSEVGFVNVVIANHGIMGPTLDDLPNDPIPSLAELQAFLWKTSMSDFNETYNINTTSMFYTLLAFLPLLDQGNKCDKSPTIATGVKSQFVATASIGAFSRRPSAGYAYAGSKAALIHMMKQCATGLVPYDIRVNVIAPGVYPSGMSDVSIIETVKLIVLSIRISLI